MKKAEFTLLGLQHLTGSKKLGIIKKYGTRSVKTDFSILLGITPRYYSNDDVVLQQRTGCYFLKTYNNENISDGTIACMYIDFDGSAGATDVRRRNIGVRPAIKYTDLTQIVSSIDDSQEEIYYGEYPQWVASEEISKEMENLFVKGFLVETGKFYTTDSLIFTKYKEKIKERNFTEYEFKGKKYIRFIGDKINKGQKLSDGRVIEEGKAYYVEVSKVKWLLDKEENIALSENILFSGIQFNDVKDYKMDLEHTTIYWYLNSIFSQDLIPSRCIKKEKELLNKKREILETISLVKQRIENGEEVELVKDDSSYTYKFPSYKN